MFRRAIGRGKLSHAYLLIGPRGIGKKTFVRTLAQCLFCSRYPEAALEACGQCSGCKQVIAHTHPDLLTVACPEGKRELSIDLIAGSADKRGREGLCHDLMLRPMMGARRVALIDDAECLNDESSNSLLKTLEEPPNGSVVFLLSPDLDLILPTIRSRCQPVLFSALTTTQVKELLMSTGIANEVAQADRMAEMAEGSLETAQKLADSSVESLKTLMEERFPQLDHNSYAIGRAVLTAIEEAGGDSSAQRARAIWAVRFAVTYYLRQFRQTPPEATETLERLTQALDRTIQVEGQLMGMMSVPLCVEGWFSDLGRVSRGGA